MSAHKSVLPTHNFRIANFPVSAKRSLIPVLPTHHSCIANTQCCKMVLNSLIVNMPFLYCQHASSILPTHRFRIANMPVPYCQHTVSVLSTYPVLSHGYQQPYCKRTVPVLSTCQFRIVTTPFRIANTPVPAKRTSIPLPQARLTSHANTKRGAAQHQLHGSSQKKKAVTYSPALHCSTIGASGLNFSVRNGKRWDTTAIAT